VRVSRWLAVIPAGLALAVTTATPAAAHPLGNFTVNTADRLLVTSSGVEIVHVVDLAEIPTVQLAQDRTGPPDGDGRLSASELDAFAAQECARTAALLALRVDGEARALTADSSSAETRPGQAGLPTTRVECRYSSEGPVRGEVAFDDAAARERNGWREVSAASVCGRIEESSVRDESTSALLTSYPEDLLASPLDVSTARFAVVPGGPCLAGEDASGSVADTALPRGVDRISQAFTDFLSRPDLTVPFALLAVVASVLFGVLHALAPGHGKTVMAAYLVGQRGTPRQALQLGAVVTFTHTASVLLLGAVLSLGALAAPELVVPATEVLSGVLLAAVGIYLAVLAARRLRAADHAHDHDHDHDHPHDHDHDHSHDHPHDHDRSRDHPHPDSGPSGGAVAVAVRPLVHSHGGRTHTHAPLPEGRLSWRALAGMGVAGGLVPSPSALLVLLAATALGRAWFGVLLVLAYGVGMAVTLTAAGLLLLRARAALDRRGWQLGALQRLGRLLPLGTAVLVVLVGLGLVVRGVLTGRGLL
jgi:nickel/cobalt exporter